MVHKHRPCGYLRVKLRGNEAASLRSASGTLAELPGCRERCQTVMMTTITYSFFTLCLFSAWRMRTLWQIWWEHFKQVGFESIVESILLITSVLRPADLLSILETSTYRNAVAFELNESLTDPRLTLQRYHILPPLI